MYVDDEPVGRTPIRRMALSSGTHVVQVRLRGYRPFEQRITVPSGTEEMVAAPLAPDQGSIGPAAPR